MRYHRSVPTYHVENFGCRATQADGAALECQFETRGFARASADEADLVILNTCTVTNSADQDARAAIRRVQRRNPQAKIVVTGCYAQRAPEEIAALPGVSAVVGNSHKNQLAEITLSNLFPPNVGLGLAPRFSTGKKQSSWDLDLATEVKSRNNPQFLPITTLTKNRELRTENWVFVSDIFAHTELLAAPVFESIHDGNSRTRPNLKVQDGCNNRCSFCVIPSVRGHSRSLPLPEIIRQVDALTAAGYRELVISGINLGRWGREAGFWHPAPNSTSESPAANFHTPEAASRKPNLVSLLRAILAQTQIEKLRISSVEPMDWTDDLIALVASSPRIAKHAHVPLQSGSDAVLRRMHRKYRPWHYREKIEKIRAAMPTAAIGADVMAGFPGETDAEFEATRRLVEDLPFTYLHVFTYSARPGTPAAAMSNQVPVHVARERNKILRDLAAEKKLVFMRSFVGKSLEAITLGSSLDESGLDASGAVAGPALCSESLFSEALTDNYQKLYLRGRFQANRWITAQVDEVVDGGLIGGPLVSEELSLNSPAPVTP